MNLVALVGNLATDPELRVTGNGKQVCTFRLAVSRVGSNDEADFFSVVTWGRQAQVCKDYLGIGRRVAIDGRLRHTAWDAEDGSRRSRVEVVAHRVEMLGGGKGRRAVQREAVSDEAVAAEAGAAVESDGTLPTPDFALT